MKKHDECYALPFVLVVMTVLIIIALGVMGYAQRNLEAQKNSIVRMQEKYVAAGPIEQIVAAGESGTPISFPQTTNLRFKLDTDNSTLLVASAKSADGNVWILATIKPEVLNNNVLTISQDTGKLTVNGKVQITEYRIVDKATADAEVPAPAGTGGTP